MADLKFSCPHCTQHISCDAEWGGMQIKCPACQSNITIPQAAPATPPPAPVRINVPVSHAAPPPPPPPSSRAHAPPPPAVHAPPPPPPAAASRPGLAVARETPPPPPQVEHAPQQQSLGGKENPAVQWTGLIGAFAVTAIIIGMAATWKPPERKDNIVFVREKRGRKYVTVAKFKETAGQQAKGSAAAEGDNDEKSDASSAPAVTNIAALVSRPGWTLDLQTAQIPDATASGQISGGAFTVERALLQRIGNGYLLILRQGTGPQIDHELLVSLPLKPGEKLDGNSWNITQSPTGSAPRISKRWREGAQQQMKTFTNGYAMKLEFAQTQTNALPGKLFIALPDDEKSYVAGTLQASFLTVATPAPTPQQPTAQRPQQSMTQRAQQAQRPPSQQPQQGQRPRPPY